MPDVEITIQHSAALFYAAAASNRPLVQSIEFANYGPELTGLTLSVSVLSLGEKISHEWSQPVDFLKSGSSVKQSVDLKFDIDALYQILDKQPGRIEVQLTESVQTIASATSELTVLSANSWVMEKPLSLYAGTLAAFVQPNHPSLRPVLDAASNKLKAAGLDPGLSGYQGDHSHISGMVKAIYESMQDLELTYSNPPASWDIKYSEGGQKIRTPEEVLQDRVGTCLDTATTFAALLENVGLQPVVVLIPGHAFVGYWTKAALEGFDVFREPVISMRAFMNYMDKNLVEVVETTEICRSSEARTSYLDARAHAKARVGSSELVLSGDDEGQMLSVVTARCVAENPVLPLPARIKRPDGSIEIVEYKPQEFTLAMIQEKLAQGTSGRVGSSGLAIDVPIRIKRWLDSLLDLSLRNPLINFRWPSSSIPLLLGPEMAGTLEDLLQRGQTLRLLDFQQENKVWSFRNIVEDLKNVQALTGLLNQNRVLTAVPTPVFQNRLRKVMSEAKSFTSETGSNGLFLALGMLTWRPDGRSEDISSPLILVPVNITAKNRSTEFLIEIDESSQVTPNFSLFEKLKQEYELDLNGLVNLATDDYGIDVPATFDYVRGEIAKRNLSDFRVDEAAAIGFFNFSSYRLWKDLQENWATFEKNPLVKHLIHTPGEEFKQDIPEHNFNLDELTSQLPVESDSSQVAAIARALSGETFVLQGPPGTGKSQTITNLLSRALQEGKRVLFVAEKKEALDVVKKRLDSIDLGVFTLDLHDKNMTPKAVKQQLLDVLDIEAITDRPAFEAALGEYNAALVPLESYRERLYRIGAQGEDLQSVVNKSLNYQALSPLSLSVSGEFLNQSSLEAVGKVRMTLEEAVALSLETGAAGQNPWSFSKASVTEAESLATSSKLEEITSNLGQLFARLGNSPNGKGMLSSLKTMANLTAATVLKEPFAGTRAMVTDFAGDTQKLLRQDLIEELQKLRDEQAGFSIGLENLARANLDEAITSVSGASGLFKSFSISSALKKVEKSLGVKFAPKPVNVLETLERLKIIRQRGERIMQVAAGAAGLKIDLGFNQHVLNSQKRLEDEIGNLQSRASLLNLGAKEDEQFFNGDAETELVIAELAEQVIRLFELLGADQNSVALFSGESGLGGRLVSAVPLLRQDFRDLNSQQLIRWNRLREEMAPLSAMGLEELVDELLSGSVPFDSASIGFLSGYYQALTQRLILELGFNTFDSLNLERAISKVSGTISELRRLSPGVLADELISNKGFNSGAKVGAVGDLVGLLKQKRSQPIRNMLAKHWNIITKVAPCVMASPDSVSRFLDASLEPFDMVIFDEASQIRVANSIGALGRGKAAIIVGDSQQMPPTSIAMSSVSSGDEDGDESEEMSYDMESILSQCEVSRVPDVMLTWHYRSEDESLIVFSNRKYYKGKLSSFPSPYSSRLTEGLKFEPIDGTFLRKSSEAKGTSLRTNPQEASAILEEITARVSSPDTNSESIGVVTFNLQQQRLIEKLLQDSPSKHVQAALEGFRYVSGEKEEVEPIFVKNLETVQGSERDVILFSIAFSKQDGVLPLNFGPLNNEGGQRRLNVAVTRARKLLKVFCSFSPSDIDLSRSGSTGIKHLKEFLTIAESGPGASLDVVAGKAGQRDLHKDNIAKALTEAGMQVRTDVGLSEFKVDIGVVDPKNKERLGLAILLDGPSWSSRATAADRDALPRTLLTKRMGWPAVETIWLPAWLLNPAAEIERVKKSLAAASAVPVKSKHKSVEYKKSSSAILRPPENSQSPEAIDPLAALLSAVPEFKEIPAKRIGTQTDLDFLRDKSVMEAIEKLASNLTKAEGLVSPKRFAKYIATCFGLSAVRENRVREINSVPLPQHDRDSEGFLFPTAAQQNQETLGWKKGTKDSPRAIESISILEIVNSVRSICFATHGAREEQLIKEVARCFGIQRLGPNVEARIALAIKAALSNELIKEENGYIMPAEQED